MDPNRPASNTYLEMRIAIQDERIAKLTAIIRQLLEIPVVKSSGVVTETLENV